MLFSNLKNRINKFLKKSTISPVTPDILPADTFRKAIESILENASLTGNLDDQPAQSLIDWGINSIRWVENQISPDQRAPEQVDLKTSAIRKMMHSVNNWVPSFPKQSLETNLAFLEDLSQKIRGIYGLEYKPPDQAALKKFIEDNLNKPNIEILDNLKMLFKAPNS